MADYVYTTDIVLNSFKKIMADKEVWRINRGRINEYSLYYQNSSPVAYCLVVSKRTVHMRYEVGTE